MPVRRRLLAAAMAAVALTGCSSGEVREERDRLAREASVLKAQVAGAEAERSVLSAQAKRQDQEIAQLRTRLARAEADARFVRAPLGTRAEAPPADATGAPAPAAAPAPALAEDLGPRAATVLLLIDGSPVRVADVAWCGYDRFGPRLLPTLVSDLLVERACAAKGILATDAEVEEVVETRYRAFEGRAGGPDGLRRSLEESYVTLEQFRALQRPDARHLVQAAKLINARLKTDEGLARLYDVKYGTRLKARHILYALDPMAPSPEEADKKALAKAEEAKKKLDAGADFAKIAQEESADEGSRATGGELPEFHKHMMVPAFSELAFKLKEGEVGGPVKSEFGYHLIRVEKIVPPQKTFEAAREELLKEVDALPATQIEQAEYNRLMDELRRAAKIGRP